MNKKILILHASAGSGHKKAAEAIYHSLEEKENVKLVDLVDFMPALPKYFYTKGYILLISRLVWLWTILYWFSDTPLLSLINVHLRKFCDRISSRRFIQYLVDFKPDTVISAHFLGSELVSYVKEKKGLKTKLISIVTDFGVHNFWISSGVDMYCCATDATKQILMGKGVSENKITVTGIPVDKKFLNVPGREDLSREFQLHSDRFTLLLMTGGVGIGPLDEIVEILQDEAQLLVVCGTNQELLERLKNKAHPNVKPFGFVDYVQKLMAVADVCITKAGGLTVTECLTMGLPTIFFFLIPGQEMINARTIQAHQAGLIATSPAEIKDFVLKLKNNPGLLESFRRNARSLAAPQSSSKIISLI